MAKRGASRTAFGCDSNGRAGLDSSQTADVKREFRELGERLTRDLSSEIKSLGQNIQLAVLTEIRSLVEQLPQEFGRLRAAGRPDGIPFRGHQFDNSNKFDAARATSVKDQSLQASPEFPTPLMAKLSKHGSSFSPALGGVTMPHPSPWEENCTAKTGELGKIQNGFKQLKKKNQVMPIKADPTNDCYEGLYEGLKQMRLPDKPPPVLNLNVPPHPSEEHLPEIMSCSETCAGFGATRSTAVSQEVPPSCVRSSHAPNFDFLPHLTDGSEASDVSECTSLDPSLCDVVDEPRSTSRRSVMARDGMALGDKVANRLSISRELAKRKNPQAEEKTLFAMSIKEILNHQRFDNLVGLIIMVNAVSIGWQTNHAATTLGTELPAWFSGLEKAFAVWFTTELVLRLWVYKLQFFRPFLEGWIWNYFDFLVVFAQLVELLVETLAQNASIEAGNLRLLRVLRILRLVRILRVVRVLHLISELRAIVSSIVGSVKSLGWTCVLLFLMIYIVAVYFTQSVTDHLIDRAIDGHKLNDAEKQLQGYFMSLFRAILSLFQAMSGGLDWNEMAGPLFSDFGIGHGLLFAAYIAFALLALMNVVTGVFVQTALQSARNEEDAFMTDQIVSLFSMSEKQETTISLDEIERSLTDPKSAKEWLSIGVGEADARHLFKLLDIDSTGYVPFEEFLGGALRLNGPAKAIDLLTVMQENRKAHEQIGQCLSSVEDAVKKLASDVDRLSHTHGQENKVQSHGDLSMGVDFLVHAARHNAKELGRFGSIEGALVEIQRNLVKFQSIETLLSSLSVPREADDNISIV
eukprot:TRINITY_DN12244_c0_g2_i1.p1 TRINITY_DN12244_c0_g2~~TRINITY_DN12244_c0_g2_i1.p1  ORF type:complete len:805 (-),score=147.50 TRINITY_DN12244_c0_g2_i1:118-2532(-)